MIPRALGPTTLFSGVLPEGAAPALAAIERLAAAALAAENVVDEERAPIERAARAAYTELLRESASLASDTIPREVGNPEELRRLWAEGVLLWMHFCKTSSAPLVDSLGERSLHAFPIDLPPDMAATVRLRAALVESAGLMEREVLDAERRVEHLVSVLPLKIALTEALRARYVEAGAHRAARVRIMQECYGILPLREGDVDLVITSTAIFFVLPIAGERFDAADWPDRDPAERAAIEAFIARLARANLTETWRFPAFGLFDAETLDPRLVEDLAARTGVRSDVVQRTLVTMVSVLSRSEIDQYLVHDAWGHTWQEVLNEFEWEYERLSKIGDALTPSDGPEFGGSGTLPLRDAFVARGGAVVLDEERFCASVEADLRGRIQIGLSAALSEVFADFVEAKYSRLNLEHPLPTSSLLESTALKFDLTIKDVLRQARRWSRPYRRFCADAGVREDFANQLRALGLADSGLSAALERARELLEARFAPAFVHELGSPAPQSMSVAAAALLELALLSRELEQVLVDTARERATPAWTRPKCCPDLWAVALSHCYESDRKNLFWSLDWLVRRPVRAFCDALEAALANDDSD
jgi:hypothetical protein